MYETSDRSSFFRRSFKGPHLAAPRILIGGEAVSSTSRSAGRYAPPVAWDLLGILGFALFLVGGIDFLLTWFPARFGNPEWEFATVTAALSAMPALLLGLTLLLVATLEKAWAGLARIWSVLFILGAVGLIGVAVIYGLTLPLAAKGFVVPTVGMGLKKAIVRTLVELAVYTVMMLWMGVRGLRLARSVTS